MCAGLRFGRRPVLTVQSRTEAHWQRALPAKHQFTILLTQADYHNTLFGSSTKSIFLSTFVRIIVHMFENVKRVVEKNKSLWYRKLCTKGRKAGMLKEYYSAL